MLEDAYAHTGSCVFNDTTGDHYQANTTAINSMHAVIPRGYYSNMYSCASVCDKRPQCMCSWTVLILNCVCAYTFIL